MSSFGNTAFAIRLANNNRNTLNETRSVPIVSGTVDGEDVDLQMTDAETTGTVETRYTDTTMMNDATPEAPADITANDDTNDHVGFGTIVVDTAQRTTLTESFNTDGETTGGEQQNTRVVNTNVGNGRRTFSVYLDPREPEQDDLTLLMDIPTTPSTDDPVSEAEQMAVETEPLVEQHDENDKENEEPIVAYTFGPSILYANYATPPPTPSHRRRHRRHNTPFTIFEDETATPPRTPEGKRNSEVRSRLLSDSTARIVNLR